MATKAADREGKRHPLSIRVTAEVRQGLERVASAAGRSLTQEAETRLEQSFQSQADRYGAHNERLGELVAMVAASVEKQAGADWRADDVAATYVFARIKRTLAAFMGAIENPADLPVIEEGDNRLLRAAGAKTEEEILDLRAAASAGEKDEEEMLRVLDRRSLATWRRGDGGATILPSTKRE